MLHYSIQELIQQPKNNGIPIVIPTFNNVSYLRKMIFQLEDFGINNLIILDNWSTAPKMSEFLNLLSTKYTVVKKFTNDGPTEFYWNRNFFNWLPDNFIITDPDIGFNQNLPKDFINVMKNVSEEHKLMRVGFALDIEMAGVEHNMHDIMFNLSGLTMYQWEERFWQNKIGLTEYGDQIYNAPIDTTFCFINKKYDIGDYFGPSARIAGNFTAQHYGWYINPPVPENELEYYLSVIPQHWSETGNAIKRKRKND
jgi:hypothetical protein